VIGVVESTRAAAVELAENAPWMGWNLVLALVPLALALLLFRRTERGRWWWLGAASFVLFLPNAPYVMTDVIHLYTDVRTVQSDAVLSVAVLPQYAVFFLVGVGSYIASLMLAEQYVGRRWVRPVAHAVSSIGIFLGRSLRLNSWDVVARPSEVLHGVLSAFSVRGALAIGIVFCALTLATDLAVWGWGVHTRLAAARR
jgi:uncharacterized membrane protein